MWTLCVLLSMNSHSQEDFSKFLHWFSSESGHWCERHSWGGLQYENQVCIYDIQALSSNYGTCTSLTCFQFRLGRHSHKVADMDVVGAKRLLDQVLPSKFQSIIFKSGMLMMGAVCVEIAQALKLLQNPTLLQTYLHLHPFEYWCATSIYQRAIIPFQSHCIHTANYVKSNDQNFTW